MLKRCGQRPPEGDQGNQAGLHGVVDVSLSGPDGGSRLMIRGQFVMPGAEFPIDVVRLGVGPELLVPLQVLGLARPTMQGSSSRDRFTQHPVHPLPDQGPPGKVSGVDQTC